jgi:hypothetical protein
MLGNARFGPAQLPTRAAELRKVMRVSVKVIDKEGKGVPKAVVALWHRGDDVANFWTGPEGELEFAGVASGIFDLIARSDEVRSELGKGSVFTN